MKYTAAGLLIVAGLVAGASPASAEFSLSIHDGKVTLVADNVTVRQILTEWARVGQTRVVNVEKLSGPPVTLRLEGVPEAQALDILLRSSSGFMVALRPVGNPAASIYDRILLMPPSTASASAALSRPAPPVNSPAPPPVSPPVPAQPAGQVGDEGDTDDPATPSPYANDARPPETNFDYANPQEFLRRRQEMLQQQQQQQAPGGQPALFPGSVTPYSQPQQQQPASVPTATPGATGGTARPGEIVKPPQGQPVYNPYGVTAPGTPTEPDRAKYANPYQNPPKE